MISPRKATSASNLAVPDERYKMLTRTNTKSCESLCSNTSSSKESATVLYSRKTPSGMIGARHNTFIPATTEVSKRVLSARRLRIKTFQNQLADAQQTIADLAHENRILRTLHKRQDSALAKYEATNAELPQLLHSHAEELRVWQTKYRNLQTMTKDLEQKLKQKEAIILSLSDQNKYYNQLNKDKNLDERQRLAEKLHAFESRIKEKDDDLKLMARKMQLEAKNFKQQLQNEQKKTRDLVIKLEKTRLELAGYRKLTNLNLTENLANTALRRLNGERTLDEKTKGKNSKKVSIKDDYSDQDTQLFEDLNFAVEECVSKENPISKVDFSKTPVFPAIEQNPHPEFSPLRRRLEIQLETQEPTIGEVDSMSIGTTFSKQKDSFRHKALDAEYAQLEEFKNFKDEPVYAVEVSDNHEVHDGKRNSETTPATRQYAESTTDDKETDLESVTTNDDEPSSTLFKEEISNIRKQISDDYKEREAFLDTFCRQATSNSHRDEPQKRTNTPLNNNKPKARKHKLLAALKAIDDNKSSQDS